MKVLIVIATYNEIENLPKLIDELRALISDADVLVVDDNSPDGTGRWVGKEAEMNPHVHVIIRVDERGLGSAVVRGFKYGIEHEYDYIVNMDADFSHSPEDVPRLLERIQKSNVDVVIGSRYVQGGMTPDWPFFRKMMSYSVNFWAKVTLGLKTKDNSGAFRCYRVERLKLLDWDRFISSGYSFFEETLFRLKQVGSTFEEIPIIFRDRCLGVSKINRKEAVSAIWIMLKLGLERTLNLAPIKR